MADPAYQITVSLWQGAMVPISQHWDLYKDEVDVVLLMADEIATIPDEVGGPVKVLCPIDDNADGMSRQAFDRLYRFIRLFAPWRVLTVCHMGENRSGLASAMLLHARGVPIQVAIQGVREKVRPRSSDQTHVLWNPGFVKNLTEWLG